jgi:flagellar biosynthetic protein FlhB
VAENEDGMEKSEQPSSKRIEKAREKGQVPTTKEFGPVVTIFGAMGMVVLCAPMAWQQLQQTSRHWFETAGVQTVSQENLQGIIVDVVQNSLVLFLPFSVILMVLGVLAMVVQTGPLWVKDGLQPKISKINPVKGLKKIFSLRSVMELIKSLLKLGLLISVSYLVVKDRLPDLLAFPSLGVKGAILVLGNVAGQLVLWIGLTLLMLAFMDFAYQRWQFMKDQRMTKQEVKDEHKDTEGNPLVRSRRQSLARDRARQRMMQDVPKADVIITNPTHLAVALKYNPGEEFAPTVVAKGAGHVAAKIREIARHAGVPIVENKSLAQSLFKMVTVGSTIPANLYKAVAEILAYVYRLKQEREGVQG